MGSATAADAGPTRTGRKPRITAPRAGLRADAARVPEPTRRWLVVGTSRPPGDRGRLRPRSRSLRELGADGDGWPLRRADPHRPDRGSASIATGLRGPWRRGRDVPMGGVTTDA